MATTTHTGGLKEFRSKDVIDKETLDRALEEKPPKVCTHCNDFYNKEKKLMPCGLCRHCCKLYDKDKNTHRP